MKHFTGSKGSRAVRGSVVMMVAAIGAALVGAAPGQASSQNLERPKLVNGMLRVDGTGRDDRIALRLQAGRPDVLQVDAGDDGSAEFSFERARVARIDVDVRSGDDLVRIDDGNGRFTDSIPTALDGGPGADSLAGGAGAETLRGGGGDDSIDGNGGNDAASMGAGDDTFVWDPGDGSDTIEGQGGADTMRFNGANVAEQIDLSANGNRLRFFRNVANITMDTDGVERVDFNALGGADVVNIGDLAGTDVRQVNVDLAGALGGSAGDGQSDRVVVNGTNRNDSVDVATSGSGIAVSGLRALTSIEGHEANDVLTVNGSGGNDRLSATSLAAQAIALTLDGGPGDDTLAGGPGSEALLGGDGDDSIDGNGGTDVALMGSGNDTFVWDPGDGSDTIEGQDGSDAMQFNGSNAAELFDVSANGGRVRFFRNLGNIVMDLDGVERIRNAALGGADTMTVNDLNGTDVTAVENDLAAAPALGSAGGDGQPDRTIVNGSGGDDAVRVTSDRSGVRVSGLAAEVTVSHADPAGDALAINALAGDDVVDASALSAGAIELAADGGAGDDVLLGGAGDDVLLGGDGDDVLLGGPGQDILDGGPGDNIVIQG